MSPVGPGPHPKLSWTCIGSVAWKLEVRAVLISETIRAVNTRISRIIRSQSLVVLKDSWQSSRGKLDGSDVSGGLSIIIKRMAKSMTKTRQGIDHVIQYPATSISIPDTAGPLSCPTVSVTVAKPSIQTTVPAIPCIIRPRKSIATELLPATILVPRIQAPSDSNSGILRLGALSQKCPIKGLATTATAPWMARIAEVSPWIWRGSVFRRRWNM